MIDLDTAYAAVGTIATLTTGWGDTAIDATANELARTCNDADALCAAAEHIAHTWTRRDRPTFATILEAYRTEVARRSATTRALPRATCDIVAAERGRQIAEAAYRQACTEAGRTPNLGQFRRKINAIGAPA